MFIEYLLLARQCSEYFTCAVSPNLFFVCFNDFIYLLGRGEGRERNINVWLPLTCPQQGPGPQPRHVPWLGIEPPTLWFAGKHSIHWVAPARAVSSHLDHPLGQPLLFLGKETRCTEGLGYLIGILDLPCPKILIFPFSLFWNDSATYPISQASSLFLRFQSFCTTSKIPSTQLLLLNSTTKAPDLSILIFWLDYFVTLLLTSLKIIPHMATMYSKIKSFRSHYSLSLNSSVTYPTKSKFLFMANKAIRELASVQVCFFRPMSLLWLVVLQSHAGPFVCHTCHACCCPKHAPLHLLSV